VRAVFKIIGPELDISEVLVELIGLRIGRVEANNDLALANARVSRQHMRFVWRGNDLYVEDLGSANGTWINDERVQPETPQQIKEGDSVTVGPYVLTLDHFDVPDIPLGAPTDQPEAVAEPPAKPPPPPEPEPEPEPEPPPPPEPKAKKPPAEPPPAPKKAPPEPPKPPREVPPPGVVELPTPRGRKPTLRPGEDGLFIPDGGDRGVMLPPVTTLSANGYPPGIPKDASNWLKYLPAIYSEDDFTGRYLLLFESIMSPITWIIDGFDLYLSPETAPGEWLQWMASWFDLLVVPELPIDRQRAILRQIGWLFLRRGTRPALERLLELYFGVKPEIIEDKKKACHFTVKIAMSEADFQGSRDLVERLILSQKPAFAEFTLEIK
jgi:phage tail-like protein